MKNTKIRLNKMELVPLTDQEFSAVLGGFYSTSTDGAASASSGPSASVSACNGKDVDVTQDSDAESD